MRYLVTPGLIVFLLSCSYPALPRLGGNDASGGSDAPHDAPGVDVGVDAPPQVSSCSGLAATCGPNSNDNCCATATTIPGGTFYRSYDVGTDNMFASTGYPATVSAFRLDKYEVTVGRFRQFVAAGMATQANPPAAGAGGRTLNGMASQGGWDASWNVSLTADTTALSAALKCGAQYQTWTDAPGGNESRPITCINWYEAMAFCAWDGGFLPTEAEWNFAAAGGIEQRAYPWSSPANSLTIDCSYANYKIDMPAGTFCGVATHRVGSKSPKGDGAWGQSDLGGNVLEWVLDVGGSPYPTTCNDCSNLTTSMYRVLRGGSFVSNASDVRGASRSNSGVPSSHGPFFGLRCARMP